MLYEEKRPLGTKDAVALQKEQWQNMRVEGFDEMVSSDQLFNLCSFIGNAILKSNPTVVGFQGPAKSGKTTMCRIIQMIADKHDLRSVFLHENEPEKIGECLQNTMQHASICFSMDGRIPDEVVGRNLVVWKDIVSGKERRSFWRAPTFFCSNVPIEQPGVSVIHFTLARVVNPHLLRSINIEQVEQKCLLTALLTSSRNDV